MDQRLKHFAGFFEVVAPKRRGGSSPLDRTSQKIQQNQWLTNNPFDQTRGERLFTPYVVCPKFVGNV
jgi:hypothetical protein